MPQKMVICCQKFKHIECINYGQNAYAGIKMAMHNIDSLLSSYHYDLPQELIAQRPGLSRLLVYNAQTQKITHDYFSNIKSYLPPDALLVFNRSKVFPSRLIGQKESGGKAELFLLSLLADQHLYPALIKTRSKKRLEDKFLFAHDLIATIKKINSDGTFLVSFNQENITDYVHQFAKIPIPPYIRKGESDDQDKKNYQTIYAKEEGSVAAPTAGLHFSDQLLGSIDHAFVTLHVGLGTFRPISASNLDDHQMHTENYFIDEENLGKIKTHHNVFAVGTTSLRVLESGLKHEIVPNKIYQTNIFLRPGTQIHSINGLITNFHLPESSLLVLVSTLIGREKTLEIYREAIKERYRFFSYGDAMLILR
jgi:S-adenosylmethionine:tRNA ribosyltransferase-isomerase